MSHLRKSQRSTLAYVTHEPGPDMNFFAKDHFVSSNSTRVWPVCHSTQTYLFIVGLPESTLISHSILSIYTCTIKIYKKFNLIFYSQLWYYVMQTLRKVKLGQPGNILMGVFTFWWTVFRLLWWPSIHCWQFFSVIVCAYMGISHLNQDINKGVVRLN